MRGRTRDRPLAAPRATRRCCHAVLAALAAAIPLAGPSPAGAARPVAVFSYYHAVDLPTLVREFNAARIPARVPIYFGNYWGSPRGSAPPRRQPPLPPPTEVAGERFSYAPIMPIRRGTFWERRRVSRSEGERLARAGDGRLTGRAPSLGRILRRSPRARVRWGTELGRRYRDKLRAERRDGLRAVTWQLDEVRTQVARKRGRPHRDFTRGVLLGLAYGRPALGDRKLRGIVHVAHRAFALARKRPRGEVRRFWRTLSRATLRLVGQEYPRFVGSARKAARAQAAGQRLLRRGGGARRSLAGRYVVGMTPGYRLGVGLGGNVRRRSRRRVRAWRGAYVRARARTGVAGFSQYNFRGRNRSPRVIHDAVSALAMGVRRAR